jgi:hypothetical protein
MKRRDTLFAGCVLLLTALVPGSLIALAPFAEARSTLGILAGWGLALVMMVPSYVLLARTVSEENPHRFVRAVMAGMLLRLAVTAVGVFVFALTVSETPFKSFLLSFLLGYTLLQTVELALALRREAPRTKPELRS